MKNCPNGGIKNTEDVLLLSDAFNSFILVKKSYNLSKYTLDTYKCHFGVFKAFVGDVDIRDITTYHYNQFVEYLTQRGTGQQTIKSYGNSLRSFFNWSYDNDFIHYKVNIPLIRAQSSIKNVYTNDELKLLLKKPNLKTCTFTEYKIWVVENLIICTGLRITSVINLKVKDFNKSDGSLVVNTTKNKQSFRTYLNSDMIKILIEYLSFRNPSSQDDYLFCRDDGQPIARRSLQDEANKYNKNRGVSKTSLHLLRHTFATNSILNGQDVVTLMQQLQHNDIKTTYNYIRSLNLSVKERCEIYNPQRELNINNNKITMKRRS